MKELNKKILRKDSVLSILCVCTITPPPMVSRTLIGQDGETNSAMGLMNDIRWMIYMYDLKKKSDSNGNVAFLRKRTPVPGKDAGSCRPNKIPSKLVVVAPELASHDAQRYLLIF